MRKYEVIFIVRPDTTEEDVGKLVAQMEGVVAGAGGKVEKVERMGRRRLAYRVARQREGFYVLFLIEGGGDTIKELERRLKVTDAVIKFLTVRIDEELERAAKLKERRAKQQAKKQRPKPASPPPPSQPPAAIEVPFNAPNDRPCRLSIDDGRDVFGGGVSTEAVDTCDQYTIQGDLFSRAIREGGEVPVSVEDAIKNMSVIDAVFRSAESGKWERP